MSTGIVASIAGRLWSVFFAFWIVAAFGRKAAKRRESGLERLGQLLPMTPEAARLGIVRFARESR